MAGFDDFVHPTRREILKCGSAAMLFGGMSVTARAATPNMESELIFACDGGIAQKIFEQELIPEFTRRNGVKVTYVPGQPADNLAKMRAQKSSPAMDVVWLAGAVTYKVIDDGLVAEIDHGKVPNLALIVPGISNEKATAPVGVSVVGLAYNPTAFARNGLAVPNSWWDLWNPKLKGHVGINSISLSDTQAILVKVAALLNGDPRNVDAAFAKFRELRANAPYIFTSPGARETAVQQGDLWLSSATSGVTQRIKHSGVEIEFAQPKEGLVGYAVQLGIVKGAPHPNAAYAWVDYLLSAEVQQKMVTTLGYTPVNRDAKIPADLQKFYSDLKNVLIPDWRYISAQLPAYVERWNREVER